MLKDAESMDNYSLVKEGELAPAVRKGLLAQALLIGPEAIETSENVRVDNSKTKVLSQGEQRKGIKANQG